MRFWLYPTPAQEVALRQQCAHARYVWNLAFAVVPEQIPGPGTGQVVGVDRGVAVAVALSTGQMTSPAKLGGREAERLLRLQRHLARAQKGSNRRGRVKTQNQADFECVACGHQDNADVNPARNIAERSTAAGRAVAARGDRVRLARSVKREPQLLAS